MHGPCESTSARSSAAGRARVATVAGGALALVVVALAWLARGWLANSFARPYLESAVAQRGGQLAIGHIGGSLARDLIVDDVVFEWPLGDGRGQVRLEGARLRVDATPLALARTGLAGLERVAVDARRLTIVVPAGEESDDDPDRGWSLPRALPWSGVGLGRDLGPAWSVAVEEFVIALPDGTRLRGKAVRASGSASGAGRPSRFQLAAADARLASPKLGRASAALEARGSLDATQLRLDELTFDGAPFVRALTARLEAVADGPPRDARPSDAFDVGAPHGRRLSIDGEFALGGGAVAVRGELTDSPRAGWLAVAAEGVDPRLGDAARELSWCADELGLGGSVRSLTALGRFGEGEPQLEGVLEWERPAWRGLRADRLGSTARLTPAVLEVSALEVDDHRARLRASDLRAAFEDGSLALPSLRGRLNVQMRGIDRYVTSTFLAGVWPAHELELAGRVDGTRLTLSGARFALLDSTDWIELERGSFDWDPASWRASELDLTLAMHATERLPDGLLAARLRRVPRGGEAGPETPEVADDLDDLDDSDEAPGVPEAPAPDAEGWFTGELVGEVRLHGRLDALEGHVSLGGDALSVVGRPVGRVGVDAQLDKDGVTLERFSIAGALGTLALHGRYVWTRGAFDDLRIAAQIPDIGALGLPGVVERGELDLDLHLVGPPRAPTGAVELVARDLVVSGQAIESARLEAAGAHPVYAITELSLASAEGDASLRGSFQLTEGDRAAGALAFSGSLSEFEFNRGGRQLALAGTGDVVVDRERWRVGPLEFTGSGGNATLEAGSTGAARSGLDARATFERFAPELLLGPFARTVQASRPPSAAGGESEAGAPETAEPGPLGMLEGSLALTLPSAVGGDSQAAGKAELEFTRLALWGDPRRFDGVLRGELTGGELVVERLGLQADDGTRLTLAMRTPCEPSAKQLGLAAIFSERADARSDVALSLAFEAPSLGPWADALVPGFAVGGPITAEAELSGAWRRLVGSLRVASPALEILPDAEPARPVPVPEGPGNGERYAQPGADSAAGLDPWGADETPFRWIGPLPFELELEAGEDIELRARFGEADGLADLGQARTFELDADGRLAAPFDAVALIEGRYASEQSDATLAFDVRTDMPDVADWRLLGAGRRVAGRVRADFALGGTLAEPTARGELRLDGVSARLASGVPPIANLTGTVLWTPQAATIESLQGELGAAPFTVAGQLALDGEEPLLDLVFDGEKLLLWRADGLRVRADAESVRLRGTFDELVLSGRLMLVDSRYTRTFDPLSVLDRGGGGRVPRRRGLDLMLARSGPLADLRFDLQIGSREPLAIRNNVVAGGLRPSLRVGGTGEVPLLEGRIYFDPTRVVLPAGTLTVEGGTLDFTSEDPFVPKLELRARAYLSGYQVQAEISGAYDRPEVVLSSQPVLPDDQLLVLFLTGRLPQSTVGDSSGEAARAVAVYLAVDFLHRTFANDGPIDEDSLFARFEITSGIDPARTGVETYNLSFRTRGDSGRGLAQYLTAEQDAYQRINIGYRFTVRFR